MCIRALCHPIDQCQGTVKQNMLDISFGLHEVSQIKTLIYLYVALHVHLSSSAFIIGAGNLGTVTKLCHIQPDFMEYDPDMRKILWKSEHSKPSLYCITVKCYLLCHCLRQKYGKKAELSYTQWCWGPLSSHKISPGSVKICIPYHKLTCLSFAVGIDLLYRSSFLVSPA